MTRHILIVDNERPVRTLLEHALAPLEDLNVELHTLEDGTNAIALASLYPIDLALIDMHLPGLSGLDLCSNLRSHANGSKAFIILMGEKGHELDKIELSSLQANGFAVKPFDPEEILRRVCEALGLSLED